MPKVRKEGIRVELRDVDGELGPLTVDEAKELIGWQEEPQGENWGQDFALKDTFNRKIRLTNNPTNRPLKLAIAKRYASEFLRKVWMLNLETIVFGVSGQIRDGQHRIVGFILAEQQRAINEKEWGSDPLIMEVLLGFGVSDAKDVADSYDKGQSRTLEDVVYRHEDFGVRTSDKEQRKISKLLSVALRLAWIRMGGLTVSNAPHFPHSEALEFYEKNPLILRSVKLAIGWDNGESKERLISSSISLGYVAALHYLMSRVNKSQADEFWSTFASGENLKTGSPILSLKKHLTKAKAGTGLQRDAIVGACVKAWLAFVAGENLSTKEVALKRKKEGEKLVLSEFPRIGKLDVEKEVPHRLTIKQQLILSCLSKSDADDLTYTELAEKTGLSLGNVSREIISSNGSLSNHDLVSVNQFEPQEGEKKAPYHVSLTKAGSQLVG